MEQWPGSYVDIAVTSPPIDFDEYCNDQQPADLVINIMVGDLQRIIIYPDLSLQIYQEIPKNVLNAYDKLVSLGYNKHLIQQ